MAKHFDLGDHADYQYELITPNCKESCCSGLSAEAVVITILCMKKSCIIISLLISNVVFAQTNIADVRKMKTGRNVSVSGQITAKFGNLGFIHDHTGDI